MPDLKQMSFMWDKRYGSKDYAYGKEPNAFFSGQVEKMDPGLMLLPGEGEGRNAVYTALKGWSVDAFDQSSVGQSKALVLASERGVDINYSVAQLDGFRFIPNHYDAVGLLFFHADPASRIYLHRKVCESLKPGGTLILEAFHKEQIKNNTGGPRDPDMLFDALTLSSDFATLETLFLEKLEVVLDEGPFHQGAASVIRFIGTLPKKTNNESWTKR